MNEIKENEDRNIISEILKFPFITIYNIFVYFFIGIKFFTLDIWIKIYNFINYHLNKKYRTKNSSIKDEENDIYELTKKEKKKPKKYKYSIKYLKKLEKEQEELQLNLKRLGANRSKTPHVYYFKVKEPSGKITSGTMNGYSKLDINAYLLNENYEVYSIKTSPLIDFIFKDSSFLGKTMSTKDLIFWITQLSTYLKAGLTISDAIKILNNQMKGSKARKRAFEAISYELVLGESFSSAMEKQGKMFPPLMINLVKAAEASGTLIETLDDLAEYYTEIDETKKQMLTAITYPAIVTVFAIAVIIFILVFIVPRFVEIYDNNGSEITGITKFIINVSFFLKNNYITIIGIILLIIISFRILYKSVKAFRTSVQVFLMHLPVIKKIIIYKELTIFSKTFASLLKNNVFITDSMSILSKITNNEIYRAILYKTINKIIKGEKISEAFKNHWAVPDVAYYMIVTGENTGNLANMMQKISEYYKSLHKNLVKNLESFIEPVIIAFLAVIVGIIIIAVILPVFKMYDMM